MTDDQKTERGRSSLNTDVIVFAFFLLLAFIFWYLNSLGKDGEATVKYKAVYENLPKDRSIVSNSPLFLTVTLKGSGYSLIKIKASKRDAPLKIDLSGVTYKRVPGSRNPEYFIITTGLIKNFASQIKSGCEVVSISPDTLFLNFERQALRK